VGVWFMFSSYAVVFEDKWSMEALHYSKSLVVWRWWDAFWMSCGFGLLTIIVIMIPTAAVTYTIGYLLGNSQDIISAVLSDTLIDLISIPSTYIAVWLFLAFQKFPKQPETPV
jgi:ABC-type Fe3+ transport system permease subunit